MRCSPSPDEENGKTVVTNWYTTCGGCGKTVLVVDTKRTHDGCKVKNSQVERITALWLEAAMRDDNETADQLYQQIEEIDNRPARMLDSALHYASWGWPVFPLKQNTKIPATRNGFKDATTDTTQIRQWWTENPQQNIGLPTGHHFDVIDIDIPHGYESYAQIEEEGLIPDVHGMVHTSSAGMHLYIPKTGDGNRAGIMPGIDYRGRGGYVVAPPSTLGERGRSWSWTLYPSPEIKGAINYDKA